MTLENCQKEKEGVKKSQGLTCNLFFFSHREEEQNSMPVIF